MPSLYMLGTGGTLTVQAGPERAWTVSTGTPAVIHESLGWVSVATDSATTAYYYWPNYSAYHGTVTLTDFRADGWAGTQVAPVETWPDSLIARLQAEQDARLTYMQDAVRQGDRGPAGEPTDPPLTEEDLQAMAEARRAHTRQRTAGRTAADAVAGRAAEALRLPPPFPEPRAQSRVDEWRDACVRAEALLLTQLNPEQRAEYTHHRYFHVVTDTYRYRLQHGRVGNIAELDNTGRVVATLCVHPRAAVPDEDTLLTQLLYLRYDEETLRARANRSETAWGYTQRRRAELGQGERTLQQQLEDTLVGQPVAV